MITTNHSFNRLIIVSYRLPFKIQQSDAGTEIVQNSGGLVSAVLSMAEQMGSAAEGPLAKIHWVGHADSSLKEIDSATMENESFVAHPVYMDDDVHAGFYEGFSNDLIWPCSTIFRRTPSFGRLILFITSRQIPAFWKNSTP